MMRWLGYALIAAAIGWGLYLALTRLSGAAVPVPPPAGAAEADQGTGSRIFAGGTVEGAQREMSLQFEIAGRIREMRVSPGSRVADIYGTTDISERHRHRYEVNTNYKGRLEQRGMRFSGMSPDGVLPEIIEYDDHPWFIGVQFHPELKSRPFEPHPLFASFIEAAVEQSRLV